MNTPMNTITINGEEYVRKADVATQQNAVNTEGLPYVICRGYYCGVHAGYLKKQDGDHCELVNSRRLWSWRAKEGISLSSVAMYGIKETELPCELPTIWLGDVYEVIPCTEAAAETIRKAPIREQA